MCGHKAARTVVTLVPPESVRYVDNTASAVSTIKNPKQRGLGSG
jgi:hypothetical protein